MLDVLLVTSLVMRVHDVISIIINNVVMTTFRWSSSAHSFYQSLIVAVMWSVVGRGIRPTTFSRRRQLEVVLTTWRPVVDRLARSDRLRPDRRPQLGVGRRRLCRGEAGCSD